MAKGTRFDKKGKIASHVVYALLIISGVLSVMPLISVNAPLQWVAAKIILLIAAISASIDILPLPNLTVMVKESLRPIATQSKLNCHLSPCHLR